MKLIPTPHMSIIGLYIRYINPIYITFIIEDRPNPNKSFQFGMIVWPVSVRKHWNSISLEVVCDFQYLFLTGIGIVFGQTLKSLNTYDV
jgi:hypothetical protein